MRAPLGGEGRRVSGLQWIVLVAVLVVVLAALAAALAGRLTLRADDPAGRTPGHPVLLPERPRAADVDLLRLAVAVPGYQRDQVDAVLLRLRDALAQCEDEVTALRARVAELEAADPSRSDPAGRA